MNTGTVTLERRIAARPQTVFTFFTDRDRWLSWMGKDGTFDFERYEQVLRDYYGKSSADFEAELRRRHARVCAGVEDRLRDVADDAPERIAVREHLGEAR